MTEIVVRTGPGMIEVAVIEQGRLLDYRLEFPDRPSGVGALYHGRIGAVLPAMGGAFVILGDQPDAFLPERDAPAGISEGTAIAVRVVRASQGGKGPRVTGRLEPEVASHILAQPPGIASRGPDAVQIAAAAWPNALIRIDDIHHAAHYRAGLGERVRHDYAPLVDDLNEAIALLSATHVPLPGGLTASITPTPALVAIDLDTGSSSGARALKATAQFAANRDALPALMQQIRLRDLSGAIVIDLAGMPQRKRPALAPVVIESLRTDPLSPRFVGFSGLGLLEILRPRLRAPLHEQRALPMSAVCAGLRAWLADPRQTRLVFAPDLAEEFVRAPIAMADTKRIAGLSAICRADPALPSGTWRLES